jgi:hypothetical protein
MLTVGTSTTIRWQSLAASGTVFTADVSCDGATHLDAHGRPVVDQSANVEHRWPSQPIGIACN